MKTQVCQVTTYHFKQFLNKYAEKKLQLFCDIETAEINKGAGARRPSLYDNFEYSVQVSFFEKGQLYYNIDFCSIKDFLNFLDENLLRKTRVELLFHNGNNYDNHYILKSLLNECGCLRGAWYQKTAEDNEDAIKVKGLRNHMVLEKRVKSASNLALIFKLSNSKVIYETVDTLLKFGHRSIESLGKTMLKMNLIKEEYLKTSINYSKYDSDDPLTIAEIQKLREHIHARATSDEKTYWANDVIILGLAVHNYDVMFPGFDFGKITFSQNVLAEYKTNPLANLQLLNRYQDGKKEMQIKFSDYDFDGENLFDYLKHFYKGGLNFYNDSYVNKIINEPMVSYDLNSSYPAVMYTNKIPTYLISAHNEPLQYTIKYNCDYYHMWKITIDEFNRLIDRVPSTLLRKLLTKYYSNFTDFVYINSNTIETINLFATTKIKKLKALSHLCWECEYFGGREVIKENYKLKTQGKNDHQINADDPTKIKILPEINTKIMSKAEISTAKVILNGIYGLPALRPYYNYFKYDQKSNLLISEPDGYKNSERNQIFSIFITSQAFYNLLFPLRTVPPSKIDTGLIYGDTDSLYLKKELDQYVNHDNFNNFNLGDFKTEHQISKFYVLNHKKYCAWDAEKDELFFHCGGVPLDNFELDDSFDDFVNKQFSPGRKIKVIRSMRTVHNTMAIYESSTQLQRAKKYATKMNKNLAKMRGEIVKEIKKQPEEKEVAYYELGDGTVLGLTEVSKNHEKTGFKITQLIDKYGRIKETLKEKEDLKKW